MTADPLPAGSKIGILGGGQLGRMLCAAASKLGMRTHVFADGPDPPAGQLANQVSISGYDDIEMLRRFATSVDVATYEFENIPSSTIDAVSGFCPVRPGRSALVTSQDRLVEKSFLRDSGIDVAPFVGIDNRSELLDAAKAIGFPAILKSRRFGYDGKGQARLRTVHDIERAMNAVGNKPALLEQHVAFDLEISVIGARAIRGTMVCFGPGENVHENGILRTTRVPARISKDLEKRAISISETIMEKLDYVGVIGVEFFVSGEDLLVNEIAPRVHNSGHWTQNGCVVDQFEQHIRAICNWPLGDARRHADVTMVNIIGKEVLSVRELARKNDHAIHLYGKSEARPGRKMGHVNKTSPTSGSRQFVTASIRDQSPKCRT